MATTLVCRQALRRQLVPITLGLTSGAWLLSRQRPLRLDALPPPARTTSTQSQGKAAEKLDPNILKQLSSGSLSGFLAGLVVSVFSRTLVILIGVAIVAVQVAARSGIDLVRYFKLKEKARSSRILSSLQENTTFKLCFGLTFAMSAFMHF